MEDRDVLLSRLDALLATGPGVESEIDGEAWAAALQGVPPERVMRATIAAVRELLLPEWHERRPKDPRPERALAAAEAWLEKKTEEACAYAKVTAKACTAARTDTLGYEHRVAEAARHVATAVGAREPTHLYDALASVGEELAYRISLDAEYHRGPERCRDLVDVVRRVLLEAEAPLEDSGSASDASPALESVPYSPGRRFELGQHLVHKKFGEAVVSRLGETWIEVTLLDGSVKRLAHHP